MAALDRRIARNVTPDPVPVGAMIFQPSPERRRSGSHYTPRSLTQPIVEAALAPILKKLGDQPRPEQILVLRVCDPAMGSGAFLVEACRQLGDALVTAWHVHKDPFETCATRGATMPISPVTSRRFRRVDVASCLGQTKSPPSKRRLRSLDLPTPRRSCGWESFIP